jgi:hypothetical protein
MMFHDFHEFSLFFMMFHDVSSLFIYHCLIQQRPFLHVEGNRDTVTSTTRAPVGHLLAT